MPQNKNKGDYFMTEKKVMLTEDGYNKLVEKLNYLKSVRRIEVAERLKAAIALGDLSENSEYDDAKNEQGLMEARIAQINDILSNAVLVEAPKRSNRVNIGSTVTVDMGGRERVFTIVGAAEADVSSGKISNESPVGAALLGGKKGDHFTAEGPTGRVIEMDIVKIEH